MFSTLGLFSKTRCPDRVNCKRPNCVFSHSSDLPPEQSLKIPVHVPKPQQQLQPTPSSSSSVSAKRSAPTSVSNDMYVREPPTKVQRTGKNARSVVAAPLQPTSGVPVLKVVPSRSIIAIPVRQTMLKSLYDHFVVLYENLLPTNPTLASEHSLKQEEEVYKTATKFTYRNAVISSIASLKRRPVPDSIAHDSVGTEVDLAARIESKKSIEALRVTPAHISPYIMSMEDMVKWGYFVEIPPGPGGDAPSEEGKVQTCDRCRKPVQIKRQEEAEECEYHWGRPFSTKLNGEKMRVYSCCSKPTSNPEGCTHGPHVFYEKDAENLHRRHAFSHTRPPHTSGADNALDVAALDCEMIYTTGGMRVARVSVVDGSGTEVFDELVRMDDEVHIIDYNTRFSGITPEDYSKSALLQLSGIRKSLDTLINSETILIGHALDNDLKTLRMIHFRNVDTAIMFRHPSGHPYRRALRDLVKEHLGQRIQTAGAAGHSSVEDSIATLNLVRFYVLNKPKLPMKVPQPPKALPADPSIPKREVITID